jgi:hypothetical protein
MTTITDHRDTAELRFKELTGHDVDTNNGDDIDLIHGLLHIEVGEESHFGVDHSGSAGSLVTGQYDKVIGQVEIEN